MQYLTLWDFILTPIFLIILISIARKRSSRLYAYNNPLRKYYMQGLYLKFFGAIFIALIYQYYYKGGDTYNFFTHAKLINSSLEDGVGTWFKLITRQPLRDNPELYQYTYQMEWYNDPASYTVAIIAAIFGLICGTHYLPIAVLFAYFSFTGIWAMYRTFVVVYPKLHKELAIAFLFIPSTFVWGSAVFKDTICMFGIGWLTYTTFRIFIHRDFTLGNSLLLVLSFYLILKIKVYILMAFVPALAIWLLTTYSSKIKSGVLRFLLRIAFIGLTLVAFVFFAQVFSAELKKYSLENIAKTAAETRGWLTYASGDEGSAYDLGEFDPSIGGMLQKMPQAIVVTLFRPFPWEARKVIVMLSALEALLFIFFTLKAFRKNGVLKTFRLIGKDPNLLFFLIFTIIFAFAVGISSYNFGALSRYKIPCLPFYAGFLLILINYKKLSAKPAVAQVKSPANEGALTSTL